MIDEGVKCAFPPSIDSYTRLLVLGSLPGAASLAAGQYYANPANQFWRLIGGVIDRDLVPLDYPDRLARLRAQGVGLWDMIRSARRAGSLDSAIRDIEPSDLPALTSGLPHLRAIAFNGAKAASIGILQMRGAGRGDLDQIALPSSSAAYCTISLEAKQVQWDRLKSYLGSEVA